MKPGCMALLAFGVLPTPALAQATVGVEGIRFEPDSFVVQMGDTLRFHGTPVDEAGAPVAGAVWGATDGSVFELEAVAASDSGQAFALWGLEVGRGAMGLFVADLSGGEPRWRRIGGVEIEVIDYPVARIEPLQLPYVPFAGTRFGVQARVLNAVGEEHATATVRWTTSDSTRAVVDDDDTLWLHRPGTVRLVASADTVHATLEIEVRPNPAERVGLASPSGQLRTGDVANLQPTVLDSSGEAVADVAIAYEVVGDDGREGGAEVYADGAFVASAPGRYRVGAEAGSAAGSLQVEVFPREVGQSATFVAHVPTPRATDLWVFEGLDSRDYAYVGTLSAATMYAVDVTDPAAPFLTDSIKAEGRRVNDVKINERRDLAIVTSESAANRRNGITLLDITTPAHPRIVTHYTDGLTGGVHNVWFAGDLVYAVNDGTRDVHIIDVSDPSAPLEVGRWGLERRGRYLHDISVVDGLAYASYWNDGVVILDVGAGLANGSPTAPSVVSSFKYRYEINGATFGNTHHAIRYGDYLFLGDEIFGCPGCRGPRGYIHVVDVSDVRAPREVAFYRVPDAGSHNIWVEDDRLYVAYYQGGVRVVDVSGELRGDLLAQGREIATFYTDERGRSAGRDEDPALTEAGGAIAPGDGPSSGTLRPSGTGPGAQLGPAGPPPGGFGFGARAWGPQPYKGHLFVSDMNSGLWIVRLEPRPVLP